MERGGENKRGEERRGEERSGKEEQQSVEDGIYVELQVKPPYDLLVYEPEGLSPGLVMDLGCCFVVSLWDCCLRFVV